MTCNGRTPGTVAARYDLSGKGHNHHFQCNGCGLVYELRGCVGGFRNMIPREFLVTKQEVLLYGMCGDCRSTGRAKGLKGVCLPAYLLVGGRDSEFFRIETAQPD